MLAVTTPAATTALTTLANVKLALDIKTGTDDAWLRRQIDVVSSIAISVLGVEMAEDGSRHFGVETVTETLDRRTRYPWLPPLGVIAPRREADTIIVLGRRPVISIASVTEDGTAVDPGDYELSATDGKVKRLSSDLAAAWPCTLIVASYTAGWKLPGDSGTNLPPEIEEAVIQGVKERVAGRKRDPNVRSENVAGVREVQYFFGAPGQDQPLSPTVMAMLNPYRNMSL
jgi:hypothetical protein